ncbi:hypothetical protein HY419_02060, partial [candidate division WWE3 bacterium]|nr:hypothetical protein [candidate division WWE3 bacterium]
LLGYYKDILYEHGSSKVSFGKISNNRVEETTTPLEYTFAKADFYRTIYKAPIYGPRFDEGMLQIVMAIPLANKEELSTVKIQAHEWSLDTDKFGRYPSLNVAEAWKKVSANQGVVSKLKLRSSSSFEKDSAQTVSKIFIENVSIGYYDSPNFQPYMQPIYVFDGTFTTPDGQQGQIAIYYPALDPKVFN